MSALADATDTRPAGLSTQRWGLTGGIGSGKSTVAAMLQACGATLIDTDALSRALTASGGAAMPAIRAAFGESMVAPDGALARDAMRQLVFNDSDARRRLEAILHPMIGAQTRVRAQYAVDAGSPVVVFDVPLLAESKVWRHQVERIVVVDCHEATQIERVVKRPGWSLAAASAVVAQQATRAQRRAIADAVLFNDCIDLPTLEGLVKDLWRRWVAPS